MGTIHIVLDQELLQAIDRAARRKKQSPSALVREATPTADDRGVQSLGIRSDFAFT